MTILHSPYLPLIVYGAVNIVAIGLMIASQKAPIIARFGFSILFAAACWYNVTTALKAPWIFQDLADYAVFESYRRFFDGPFDQIATPFMLLISAIQGFIALSMPLTGRLVRIGSITGLLFCLALVPLGLGAAFPAAVFLAIGFYWLYRHPADRKLVSWSGRQVRSATSRPLPPRKPVKSAHSI